jgi:hypothetical protein
MRPIPARRATVLTTVAVALTLSACATDPAPDLHDLTVVGAIDQRVTWLYGAPRSFVLDGVERVLEAPSDAATLDAWAVPDALWVDGAPTLRAPATGVPSEAPAEVRRIPLTTDLRLTTQRETTALLYFDGSSWLELGTFDPAGLDVVVTPRPRLRGLEGLGELTAAEARVLQRALEDLGEPLVVAFLTGDDVPRRAVDGTGELRATAVHVTVGLQTDASALRPTPRDVPFEVVAQGSQAVGIVAPEYRLLQTRDELSRAWNQAYGASLEVPRLPAADLARETLVAVFLGPKPTGGYGLDVRATTFDGGDLYVDVRERAPAADAIVTQAITSPWLLLRIPRGDVAAVWFRDAVDGRLLAVARRTQ